MSQFIYFHHHVSFPQNSSLMFWATTRVACRCYQYSETFNIASTINTVPEGVLESLDTTYQTTRYHRPEDCNINFHRPEKLNLMLSFFLKQPFPHLNFICIVHLYSISYLKSCLYVFNPLKTEFLLNNI
jgi:hypothetical protein